MQIIFTTNRDSRKMQIEKIEKIDCAISKENNECQR